MDKYERLNNEQKKALKAWLNNHGRGIIKAATGTGKTRIGLMAIEHMQKYFKNPVIYILCPTTDIRDKEWPEEAKKWGVDISKVTRLCFSSAYKIKENPHLVIFDEYHRITDNYISFLSSVKALAMMGLTASYRIKYKPNLFLYMKNNFNMKVVHSISLSYAIEQSLVSDYTLVHVNINMSKEESIEYKKLDETFKVAKFRYYQDKKNEGFYKSAMSRRANFIYNSKTKLELGKKLYQIFKDKNIRFILFGKRKSQIEEITDCVYHSESDDKHFKDFIDEDLNHLAVIEKIDEGVNVPNLQACVILQSSSVDRQIIQRIGRAVRFKEGHKALIIVVSLANTQDELWVRNATYNLNVAEELSEFNEISFIEKYL